jgi:hypothetical protein
LVETEIGEEEDAAVHSEDWKNARWGGEHGNAPVGDEQRAA